jgi:hypothetical protein
MIGMAMGDDGAVHGADRVDERARGGAIKPFGTDFEPGAGMERGAGVQHNQLNRRAPLSRQYDISGGAA